MNAIETDLRTKLDTLRAAQLAGGIPRVEVRKARLQKCIDLLVDNQDAIVRALDADYSGRPERRKAPFPLGLFGARAEKIKPSEFNPATADLISSSQVRRASGEG